MLDAKQQFAAYCSLSPSLSLLWETASNFTAHLGGAVCLACSALPVCVTQLPCRGREGLFQVLTQAWR